MRDHSRAQQSHRLLVWVLYLAFAAIFIVAGVIAALYYGYSRDLPNVSKLEEFRPDVITELYSDDNRIIGRFAIERRILISYSQIPEYFKKAIIAAEDKHFYDHPGVDIFSILRAAVKNLLAGRIVEGGSTLTQQLSTLLFLKRERSFERKFKEALLAMEIERRYSKEQILTLYCNQIYMGHGTYGVAAAAEYYFGKKPEELTIDECAMLAALPKSPMYSPFLNPEKALLRRNYVLERMADEGYISRQQAERLKRTPIKLRAHDRRAELAPYFVEWVRRYLEERYETDEIWRKGLRVYTTLNVEMQRAANRAIAEALRAYDKRHGWRGARENILSNGSGDLGGYQHPDWKRPFEVGDIIAGLVVEVKDKRARIRFGKYEASIGPKEIEWTKADTPAKLLKVGDIAHFKIESIDAEKKRLSVTLEQIPEVQGALLAIDNGTGAIKAMVGGYDFNASKFNRATQALRQTGSAFKPFVYTAALESGMSPDDTVLDAPVSFHDGIGRVWSPQNYDGEYKGNITLRKALAESRNIPAVRLASQIGIYNLIRVARRFGISGQLQPYLPLALGASEATLLEMTSAFTVFPNRGIQAKPFFVRRVVTYDGKVKEEHIVQHRQVISPEVAAQMVELLRGVVEFGTAQKAKALGRPVAGKTGTTNDFTDAWFIGFTPSLTCGVWVGFDEKRSMGKREEGARVALPAWIDFMKEALKDKPVEEFQTPEPAIPEEIEGQQPAAPTQRRIVVEDILR